MLQSLIAPVSGLLDKFIEDKDKKNALAHEIATMAQNTHKSWQRHRLKLIRRKRHIQASLSQVGDLLGMGGCTWDGRALFGYPSGEL